jgi:hypothetical protein
MRITRRAALAIAIVSTVLFATTSVASAGRPLTTGALEVSCNSLGVYDVTLTVTSNDNGDITLSDPFFEADDANGDIITEGPLPPFQPTMLLQTGATALLEFQVPGNTVDLYAEWQTGPQSADIAELFDLEPCLPETTTTVPEETTTTEAPAPVAAAAVASPRFTG